MLKRFIEGDNKEMNDEIELVPGQFSLSRSGQGMLRLIAPVKSTSCFNAAGDKSAVADEITPKPGEFLHARFRALSKIYIEDYCVDFRKDDVLERSAPLLKNQTVYADHNVSIHNWLGVVINSFWDKVSDPAGVDADIIIDTTLNPKIARGLTIQPPAIHSASVTTFFYWSKSHPDLNDFDFFMNLGDEVDGEIVRVIVDEIIQYGELSLVWQGADPHAKRKLQASVNQIRLHPHQSFPSISAEQEQGGETMDQAQEIQKLQEQIATLQAEKDAATKTGEELQAKITALEKDAASGKKYRDKLVGETESLYRLLRGESANDEHIEKLIRNAPVENLEMQKSDYETLLGDKLSFNCPHCGKKIEGLRRSAENPVDKEKKEDPETAKKEAEQHKV